MNTTTTSALQRYYVFFGLLAAFCALAISVNLVVRRAPVHDAIIVQDLRNLGPAVDNYYLSQNRLPANLKAVSLSGLDTAKRLEAYKYRQTGTTTYELCATFLTERSQAGNNYSQPTYPNGIATPNPEIHHQGFQCFSYTVIPITQPYPAKL